VYYRATVGAMSLGVMLVNSVIYWHGLLLFLWAN